MSGSENVVAEYQPTEEEVLAAVARLKAQREKRSDYQKKRNEILKTDPEAAAKAADARKAYNQSEKAKDRRKAYYEKNKDKIYASHKRYHAKQRALLAKAKEMGLLDEKKEEAAA
jgi:hypothetical protein